MLVLFTPRTDEKKKLQDFPFCTVLVPAFNEQRSIRETLLSIISLDYPKDKLEVIVINDGSADNTKQIIQDFIKTHPKENISLINQHNHGKGRALNVGLKRAKGEFFACLDADSFISPNGLKAMLPYFCDPSVAAVCPLLKVKKPENMLQKVQWNEYIINMFHKYLNAQLDCVHVTPGPFSVYRTAIIKKIGGYDESTITEDLEIAIRLQKHNYKIVQTFDATVETVAPLTWKKLFRQRVRWYKGSLDNSLRYKELMFNKKYGDFGYIRMPTIVLSGLLAIILSGLLIWEAGKKGLTLISHLQAINFDLLTLLKNFSWNLNLLLLPYSKIVIIISLSLLSFIVMILSYKIIKEKITNYGRTWISLLCYLTVYAFFISGVWMYIAYLYVIKKGNRWS
jgi:cellulose synthase/poly-beta-1,6-N-acetylglucosamine synthase-like glycosyltransferase